ncbi:unnamed protein product, partial [Oikopleura dioica]
NPADCVGAVPPPLNAWLNRSKEQFYHTGQIGRLPHHHSFSTESKPPKLRQIKQIGALARPGRPEELMRWNHIWDHPEPGRTMFVYD